MSPIEPRILSSVSEMQRWSEPLRGAGRRIALVPTMGALHEGHLSLVRMACAVADRVVVSIFVNPTQFGPREDFERYPRSLERDLERLRSERVDVVFAPTVTEIYPQGNATVVQVERFSEGMCGASRPGHFRGVTTVVARLFNAVRPHVAIFGEKDYQQLVTIRRMTRDLLFDIEILSAPTVREPDGLAMSSRNAYLSPEARRQALALCAALQEARALFRAGVTDARALQDAALRRLRKEPDLQVEYVELRDAESLAPLERIDRPAVLGLAAVIAGTRLIDNTVLEGV